MGGGQVFHGGGEVDGSGLGPGAGQGGDDSHQLVGCFHDVMPLLR